MKRSLCLLLSILMLFMLFAGCGASKMEASDSASVEMMNTSQSSGAVRGDEYGWVDWVEPGESEQYDMEESTAEEPAVADPAAEETTDVGEKIIYTANLAVETREFDESVTSVEAMVEAFGGYIQDSSISGDSWYREDGSTTVINRYAWYTVAVPVESFEDFLKQAGGIGNVTSESRSAENITSQYTDIEARIQSLEVQEERLLAMMEEATDIETLVTLEARLSEVTYEIEAYERQLQNWDRRVAYSTITIELWEVANYTQTAAVTRTYSEKLTDALSDGWNGFVRGTGDFVLFLAESLPMLVLLIAVFVAGLVSVRKFRKNRRKKVKVEEKPKENPDDQ